MQSRDQAVIARRLAKFDKAKLEVDEVRNKADVRAYLAHVARKHVSLELTTVALEENLEREFGLTKLSLEGKLSELEVLIAKSKDIYNAVVSNHVGESDYLAMCAVAD